jgi:uncharacterized low-complexity protein
MSHRTGITPLGLALGSVFTVSLANTAIAQTAENPFTMTPLSGPGVLLAEGRCGEGKCGGGMRGEGRCGMNRMDADGDGKVTKDEFMKGHEAMFERMDDNDDGVIDQTERAGHMHRKRGCMKDSKDAAGQGGGPAQTQQATPTP